MADRNQRMTQAELDALIEEVNGMTVAQVQAALESSGVTPGAVERFNAANNGEEVRYDIIYIALLQARYNELVMGAAADVPANATERIVGLENGVESLYTLGFSKTGDAIGEWEDGNISATNGKKGVSTTYKWCPSFIAVPEYAESIEIYNAKTDGYIGLYTATEYAGADGFLGREQYRSGKKLTINPTTASGRVKYLRVSYQIGNNAEPTDVNVSFRSPISETLRKIDSPVIETHRNAIGPFLEIAETYMNQHYRYVDGGVGHQFEYESQHNLFANDIMAKTDSSGAPLTNVFAMTCTGLAEACLFGIPFEYSRYAGKNNKRIPWGFVTDGTGDYAADPLHNRSFENYGECVEIVDPASDANPHDEGWVVETTGSDYEYALTGDTHVVDGTTYYKVVPSDAEYMLSGQLCKYFEDHSNLEPVDFYRQNIKPGDILFYNDHTGAPSRTNNVDSDDDGIHEDNIEQDGDGDAAQQGGEDDTGHYRDIHHVAICLGNITDMDNIGDKAYRCVESAGKGNVFMTSTRTYAPKSWGTLAYVAKPPVNAEYQTTMLYDDNNRYAGTIPQSEVVDGETVPVRTVEVKTFALDDPLPYGFYTVCIHSTTEATNKNIGVWIMQAGESAPRKPNGDPDNSRRVFVNNRAGEAKIVFYAEKPVVRMSVRAQRGDAGAGVDDYYDIDRISIYKGYYPD